MSNYQLRRKKKKDNYRLGILLMLLAAFCFALIALFINLLDNIPLMEIVFFRNFLSMIIVPIILLRKKIPIMGNNKTLLVARGLFGCLGMIGMFYSYTKMPMTDAVTIQRLSPFFVIVLSVLFLKEKLNLRQIPFIMLAFLGVLLVLKPGMRADIFPGLIGLAAAVFMATTHVILRRLRLTDNYWVVINYFAYITGLTALAVLLIQGNFIIPTRSELIFLLLLGLVAIGSQIGLTLAYRYAPASMVAPYLYSQIIFAGILEIVFLKDFPDLLTLIGSSIIIISGVLNYRLNKKNTEK